MATTRISIKDNIFFKYFLPIFLLGWVGNSLKFLQVIFNNNTRWLIFFVLLVFLITRRNLVQLFDARMAFILFVYGGWCLLTVFWSGLPLYSFIKVSLFLIFIPMLIFAGIIWVRSFSVWNALHYLILLSFFSVLSGPFGHHANKLTDYYWGLANGSNAFGFLLSVSFPFFLWIAYKRWAVRYERLIWLVLIGLIFHYIFLTMSRSSILITIITLLLFVISLNLNRKLTIIVGSLLVSIGIILINTSFLLKIIDACSHIVYKNGGGSIESLVGSRANPWKYSYEGAEEGGWMGIGFGNSFVQNDLGTTNNLTSLGHLREKGNSQLAIVEETGFVGLIFYSIFLLYLSLKSANLYLAVNDPDLKILVAIIIGTIFGLIAQSVFEGWWYAPCAPEFVYFWLTIGIIRGVEISIPKYESTFVRS